MYEYMLNSLNKAYEVYVLKMITVFLFLTELKITMKTPSAKIEYQFYNHCKMKRNRDIL